ncbi:MAG: hypothetical protein WBN28_12390, partial [Lutimonas sp.]
MKSLARIFILIIFAFNCLAVQSQSRKDKKKQKEYISTYEEQTLNDAVLPVMMPYNRWIDPAGEQIYFGDTQLENHALDCAVSPDGKWVAVEDRYSIVIFSPEDKNTIYRFALNKYFGRTNVMNTFSGISWNIENDNYELYWGASVNGGKSYVIKAEWNKPDIV